MTTSLTLRSCHVWRLFFSQNTCSFLCIFWQWVLPLLFSKQLVFFDCEFCLAVTKWCTVGIRTIVFVYVLYWTDLTTSPSLRSCLKIISFVKVGVFFWLRVLSRSHQLVYCWYTYYSFCICTILNGFDHKSNPKVMFEDYFFSQSR